jgi:glycerol uptake facilitator-like aquaporin
MEKWIVVGSIWAMTILCLTLFVRGASPAHNRAVALARARRARLKAEAQATPETGAQVAADAGQTQQSEMSKSV